MGKFEVIISMLHVLDEYLEHTTGLFVDKAGDTLHTSTASQTPDGRFCDALNVISQDFPVTLGAALAKSFPSFASARHFG